MWPFKSYTISSLPHRHLDMAKLKRATSIIVIDDDPNAFPEVSTLRAEGYNITEWRTVESLAQLESGTYDIIVLDIGGVAGKWGKRDGLEILKLLKESNPRQYIIAFSGQRAIHQLEEFWKLADSQMKKPVNVADCKRKLDEAIQELANIEHYWVKIRERLHACGVSDKKLTQLERQIVKQIHERDTSPSALTAFVTSCVESEKVQQLTVNLGVKLISTAIL
jgi:CheY-like chemotaxis protein